MNRVTRFFKITARERSVLLRSFIWVTLYRVGLWVLPFAMTKKWTSAAVAPVMTEAYDRHLVLEVIRAVRFASGFVPSASCLTQALAARKLLGHYGQMADLKIGVTKSRGTFEAHAWLEIDGRIVIGKQPMHYRYSVMGTSQTLVR